MLVLYVLPLGAAVLLLALAGLPQLALALLAVEVVVAAAVLVAKRPARARSSQPGSAQPGSNGKVLLAFGGVLAALLAITLLAARAG